MTQTRCWAWTCALTLTLAAGAAKACDKEHACQAPQTKQSEECSAECAEPVAPCYPVGSCGMSAECGCSTSCGVANPGCVRKGRKCCCDGSTPCVEGCKPDACPCEETPSCKVKKGCSCEHSKCCCEECEGKEGCCKCAHCGKCCSCPARKFTILICPCPTAPLLGLTGTGCPCNCLGCVADLLANVFASSFSCETPQGALAPNCAPYAPASGCAMAPCGFAPPMPPLPGMPPMPPIPGAFCPPMPQIMPCMLPAPVAAPRPPIANAACKWTLRHESDAIHISGPNMEATCEKVTYCGEGDWVVLEGHVHVKYHKNEDKAAVSAGRLAINVEDGSVNLNVADSPEASTSADVFQFWSNFCH